MGSGGREGISVPDYRKSMVREHLAKLGETKAVWHGWNGLSNYKHHGRRYRNTVGLDIPEIAGDWTGA